MLGAETADTSDAAAAGAISREAWFSITGRARGSGQGAGPGVHAKSDRALKSPQGLAGRAVLLGYRLFEVREYAAMQQLVRLVGGESPSEAGLQYILGLSIACSVHSSRAASESRLNAAVGHLFRAAAGLCNSEAGPLRLVLQLLRKQQQLEEQLQANRGLQYGDAAAADMDTDAPQLPDANGSAAPKGRAAAATGDGDEAQLQRRRQQQQQEARLRLQFDQAVMMLFEEKGVKEGALAFARAALSVVDEAYGPQQHQEKLQQQGMGGLSVCLSVCLSAPAQQQLSDRVQAFLFVADCTHKVSTGLTGLHVHALTPWLALAPVHCCCATCSPSVEQHLQHGL